MKGHNCLLPDQLTGVSKQLDGPWQHRIDEVRADQLTDGCQRSTDCRQALSSGQLQEMCHTAALQHPGRECTSVLTHQASAQHMSLWPEASLRGCRVTGSRCREHAC